MTVIERMNQAPDGTCVRLAGCRDVYAVRGKKGWYRCDAAKGTCSCCDFLYRRQATYTACRHLRALGLHLIAEVQRQELEATVQEHFGNPPPAEQGRHGPCVVEPSPAEFYAMSDGELRRMFA